LLYLAKVNFRNPAKKEKKCENQRSSKEELLPSITRLPAQIDLAIITMVME